MEGEILKVAYNGEYWSMVNWPCSFFLYRLRNIIIFSESNKMFDFLNIIIFSNNI
jgi:hypothetical protein